MSTLNIKEFWKKNKHRYANIASLVLVYQFLEDRQEEKIEIFKKVFPNLKYKELLRYMNEMKWRKDNYGVRIFNEFPVVIDNNDNLFNNPENIALAIYLGLEEISYIKKRRLMKVPVYEKKYETIISLSKKELDLLKSI